MPDDLPPARRDVRVDRIGFAKELDRQYVDDLKDAVKAAHPVGTRLEGDYFEATVAGTSSTEVAPSGWLRLYEAKAIDRAQFLAGIKVSTTVAKDTLSQRDYKRLATTTEGSPRLNVTRRKGVEVALVDALKGLGTAISAGAEASIAAAGEASPAGLKKVA
jgi:hypothetical protein